jgi:histidine triad (HIT) family protein
MNTHAPKDYICPICLGVRGVENGNTLIKQTDVIFQDELVTALISSFFVGIYDFPKEYGHRIFEIAQKVAVAIKQSYECDGITLRQNNEPAGDQHAFHFHLHIFPRYEDDEFNSARKALADPKDRVKYAQKLKEKL